MDAKVWDKCLNQWERIIALIKSGEYELPFLFLMQNTAEKVGGRLVKITMQRRKDGKVAVELVLHPNGPLYGGKSGDLKKFLITLEKPYELTGGKDCKGKTIFVELWDEDDIRLLKEEGLW